MAMSLTELRQKLFKLADRVIETGEPLIVERHGVRLRIAREETPRFKGGRLSRLKKQTAVIGPPLDPHESPAQCSGEPLLEVLRARTPVIKKRAGRRPK
jgi:hypothetical protein